MIRWLRTRRLRPVALAVVAWVVGAASAVAVGLVSLSIVGAGLFDPADPLAPAAEPLAGSSNTPAQATATASTTSSPGEERTLTSPGGTVVARCVEGGVYLVLWSPAPGFHADDVQRGPAPRARVTFESHESEVKIKVTCVDGVPQSRVDEEWEHADSNR